MALENRAIKLKEVAEADPVKDILYELSDLTEFMSNLKKRKKILHINSLPINSSQKELMRQYYESNKLLMECLKSGCYVSPEVREEIEETLLLPIDEIENWKQQHRPNS